MSEARLLSMVARYPHTRALARRVSDGSVFLLLRRLEARGLVSRRQGLYRLTRRGRHELDAARAVAGLMVRATRPTTGAM
jgi:DNA-binding PadR family transcriptional regulator